MNIIDVAVYIENDNEYNKYCGKIFEKKSSLVKPNEASLLDDNKSLLMKTIYDKSADKHYVLSFFGKEYTPSLKDLHMNNCDILVTDDEKFMGEKRDLCFLDELISFMQK